MQLVVQAGAEPGRNYDLKANKVTVGRQSGNDVVVPDEQVSRKHAEIEERNGTLIVTDLGSSNGTFVNGTRISSPQTLRAGDTVQVGTTVLKVTDGGGAGAQAGAGGIYDSPSPAAGGYGSSYGATPSAGYGAAAAGGYAAGSYGASQPAAGSDYSAQSAYGQSQTPTDYGQPAYGQSQTPTDYGQPAYGQNQPAYGQPNAYGQGQPQEYTPTGYGQSSTPDYGQSQGQAGVYGQTYGQQPATYGQPQPAYNQPAPAAPAARSGGFPLPLLIGGLVALLAIIGLVAFLVLSGGSGGAVGDLPTPPNSTKLDINRDDFLRLQQNNNDKTDISKVSFAAFSTRDEINTVTNFYKTEMEKKGWKQTSSDNSGTVFNKGDQSAGIAYIPLKSQAEIDSLGTVLPSLKGKVKAGENLVLLAQGPSNLFNRG